MWGNAHGGRGWADEPIEYVNVISIIENEQNAIEREEMEKKTAGNKAKASGGKKK